MTNSSKKNKSAESEKNTRPPVVVILGHVDHGKTSILDYIRKAKVAESESGGITQHTGAYQVEQSGKLITFIDTPGHEAFSAMRSRGVNVADVAILVVAADDGVMPQTKEAIKIIKKANIPYIVAINKIDKPEASIQNVKNSLTENEVLLEGYGGNVPNVEVSAKTGHGIDELLDMINLVAELEEFSDDSDKPLKAVVVESAIDEKRGATATLLVKEGVLNLGMYIAGSFTWAKIRQMEDFLGKKTEEAIPSTPVSILGFQEVPQVGEKFIQVKDQKSAEERVERKKKKEKEGYLLEIGEGKKIVNLILRSDAEGTLEAVHQLLRSIESDELALRLLEEGVGNITDSDVRLASNGKAFIVGFRVKPNALASNLAEQQGVVIITFDTIYDLVQGVRNTILQFLQPEITEEVTGRLKLLKIFRTEPSRIIAGGRVIEGEIKRGAKAVVFREEKKIGIGKLKELKKIDKDLENAVKGDEIGILFDGNVKLQEGDVIEASEKQTKEVKF